MHADNGHILRAFDSLTLLKNPITFRGDAMLEEKKKRGTRNNIYATRRPEMR